MKLVPIPPQGLIGEVALREACATSLDHVARLVTTALLAALAITDRYSLYIEAMYNDRAVIGRDGRFYAYPYTIDENNVVTIGTPSEVVLNHVPVRAPMREAAGGETAGSWFIEALKKGTEGADNKPARYLVRVIRSGLSKNGVTYPVAVLREAAPLFEGVRVFVKGDAEHIKGGGKDFRQLVGRLVEAKFVTAGNEIQAVLEVLETADIAPKLREAVERGMTDLFGLSIDADGTSKTTGKLREAVKLLRVSSVDLIIEPGAGGEIIRFAEAHQEPDMLRQQMLDQIRTRDAKRAASLESASDEEVLTAYREAVATTAPAAVATGVTQDELQRVIRLTEARADARVRIAASKLPQAAQARLVQRFIEATDFKLEDVDAAIAAEDAYGNSFRESAPVTGLGLSVEAGEQPHQKVQAMLDSFFAGKKDGFRSFREAYVQITGDTNLTGQFKACDTGRLAEASGSFREAVTASTFSDILGDSITRQMLREYNSNPMYQDWRELVDVVPVRDFRTQERTRMGGYGNLPAVAEAGSYDPLTTPGDEKSTYAITKRGGTETISIETIANDDVGVIRRIPQKLGIAAGRTLYEFVLNFLSSNAAIYDSVALFHATHANLGTAALAAASFAASRLRMQKQTEADSVKKLGLILSHVYVPVDLEETAFDMFVRSTNNDETFVQSRKPKVHVVPHWTDTNNWYATADRSQIPLIELGFFNGQEEPELFVQDNPTQGSLFTNDQIKYKIRHIYSGAVSDFRGLDGNVVA